jgi:hypothetical protein
MEGQQTKICPPKSPNVAQTHLPSISTSQISHHRLVATDTRVPFSLSHAGDY